MKQERVTYTRPREKSEQYQYDEKDAVREQEEARRAQLAQETGRTAIDGIDAVLEEIDTILEDNALEFVNAFQQKGGQ